MQSRKENADSFFLSSDDVNGGGMEAAGGMKGRQVEVKMVETMRRPRVIWNGRGR